MAPGGVFLYSSRRSLLTPTPVLARPVGKAAEESSWCFVLPPGSWQDLCCHLALHHRPWTADTWLHILQTKPSFLWSEQFGDFFFLRAMRFSVQQQQITTFESHHLLSCEHSTCYLTLGILFHKEHCKIAGKNHLRNYYCLLKDWFSKG